MSLWAYIVQVSETSVCVELTEFAILLNVFHNYIFCLFLEREINTQELHSTLYQTSETQAMALVWKTEKMNH